jgi:FimV-like protein
MSHRFLRFFQGLSLYIVTGVLCAGIVNAVGLGRIKVYSYLNEPLDAEIELLAASSVVDSVLISVASADEFERANVPRIPLLDKLMFQIIRDEDKIFIHATSKTWITEPYLDFLLNLSWGQGIAEGRLIRRYTILLDPIPPEGKPVYAKRRLMPNSIEQPDAGTRKAHYKGSATVSDLTTLALTEAAAEKGILLTELDIPVGIVAQTPQEKLTQLSKQKAETIAGAGATVQGNAEREHMHALFEQHDKGADLKTVIEDVERVILSSRSKEADTWFNEQAASSEEQAPASVQAHTETAAKVITAALPVTTATTEKSEAAASADSPVPQTVSVPAKKLRFQDYISLIVTLGITFLAGFLILSQRWKQHRQFSATRERLAQLSRDAIDEERAAVASEEQSGVFDPITQTQISETQQAVAAPVVGEEPLNMAELDLVLGDDLTVPMPPELPAVAVSSNTPAVEATPAVEEIRIDLDLAVLPENLSGPAIPATSSVASPEISTVPAPTSPVADLEEMALKLQLARQYIDLGDFTGAKELLILINTQGNAEQRTEAQELLEKII